jgi:hypothetical protein
MDMGTFTGTLLGSAPGTIQFAGRQSGNTTHLAGHIALFRGTGGLAAVRAYGPETVIQTMGAFTDTLRVWSGRYATITEGDSGRTSIGAAQLFPASIHSVWHDGLGDNQLPAGRYPHA